MTKILIFHSEICDRFKYQAQIKTSKILKLQKNYSNKISKKLALPHADCVTPLAYQNADSSENFLLKLIYNLLCVIYTSEFQSQNLRSYEKIIDNYDNLGNKF